MRYSRRISVCSFRCGFKQAVLGVACANNVAHAPYQAHIVATGSLPVVHRQRHDDTIARPRFPARRMQYDVFIVDSCAGLKTCRCSEDYFPIFRVRLHGQAMRSIPVSQSSRVAYDSNRITKACRLLQPEGAHARAWLAVCRHTITFLERVNRKRRHGTSILPCVAMHCLTCHGQIACKAHMPDNIVPYWRQLDEILVLQVGIDGQMHRRRKGVFSRAKHGYSAAGLPLAQKLVRTHQRYTCSLCCPVDLHVKLAQAA
mmetsp:Transcript_56018/g.90740  ORF Transcript_56018/g.90740 Transcript_56018/m.90740 type:complete len:258 (-) Transcript_56018:900-1673(-)